MVPRHQSGPRPQPTTFMVMSEQLYQVYRRLIPDAERLLRSSGWLIMEIGYATGDAVRAMLDGWEDVAIRADLAGLPRVVLARKP